MKGLLFHQQLEIRLEVEGEEFHQGDSVSCALTVKNRGNEPQQAGKLFLALARGDMKKVKQKADDAFTVIERAEDEAGSRTIPPGGEARLSHTFRLEKNCLVTDKNQSLCAVYGLE